MNIVVLIEEGGEGNWRETTEKQYQLALSVDIICNSFRIKLVHGVEFSFKMSKPMQQLDATVSQTEGFYLQGGSVIAVAPACQTCNTPTASLSWPEGLYSQKPINH